MHGLLTGRSSTLRWCYAELRRWHEHLALLFLGAANLSTRYTERARDKTSLLGFHTVFTMNKPTTNKKTQIRINTAAYEAIEEMRFELIDVLQSFGEEVWENNSELNQSFTAREVIDAFTHLMVQQTPQRANPNQFEALFYQ